MGKCLLEYFFKTGNMPSPEQNSARRAFLMRTGGMGHDQFHFQVERSGEAIEKGVLLDQVRSSRQGSDRRCELRPRPLIAARNPEVLQVFHVMRRARN